jgi:adenylate cyclase
MALDLLKLRLGRTHTVKLVLLAAVLVVVEIVQMAGIFDPAELVFYDLWHRIAGKRFEPKHVALVVIDEPTLNEYRNDPLVFWTPQVAQASRVAREAGAKVIGLDFLFSISPEAWLAKRATRRAAGEASHDQAFREEIGTGRLIQVSARVRLNTGIDDFLLPYTDYLMSIPDLDIPRHVALAGLHADKDTAVRSFSVAPALKLAADGDASSAPRFSLGPLLALHAAGADLNATSWRLAGHNYGRDAAVLPITYSGPPGTVPRVSMRKLLAPDALQQAEVKALRDKVVIIGGEYVGMGDLHPTPYASGFFGGIAAFMTGPEIQANVVETMLGGQRLQPLPSVLAHVYLIVLTVTGLLLFSLLSPAWGLLALMATVSFGFVAAYLAFLNWVLLPVASVPLALGIAYLGSLAVKLGAEARERERITAIFSRYVSDSVVDVLIDAEHVPELGGVKQTITVLFSDIRNFTTISEQLDAHEVVEFLNHYFEQICDVVLAEGGTIDKFIGDAIMVQFGAPLAFADHALRATRAAVAMRREAVEFRTWMQHRFAGRGLPEFNVGIGLHTGDAVVGNIGSTRRSEYTAIGDSVNLASRIEGMTKDLGCVILISRETLEAAGERVITGRSESVKVKGREAPVELFEVLDIRGEE